MQEPLDLLYKILVVGDICVGKTSIIKKYTHNIFMENYKATVGVDFALKVLGLEDSTKVKLQFWDIAGQERFNSLSRVYYKDAVAAFVVFDITRELTYTDGATKWKKDIDDKVRFPDTEEPLPVILLANKIDCGDNSELSEKIFDTIENFCRENNFITWYKTSAKTGEGITEAINEMTQIILSKTNRKQVTHIPNGFKLNSVESKTSNCC